MPNEKIRPLFLDSDSTVELIKEDSCLFSKDLTWDISANPNTGTGTGNPTGEGQNFLTLTPIRSNIEVPDTILPEGYNKTVLSFESITTQELYYGVYNSERNHTLCVLNGNTGVWSVVLQDPQLNLSDEQQHSIPDHRNRLRAVLDKNGNIIEKYWEFTDGQAWQKWISVEAAIKTNGFNATQFPYWTLLPPHFDRRELFEWATRPPMTKPVVSLIPNTPADANKINRLVNTAFRFSDNFQNTDGRFGTLAPYSLPIFVRQENYISDPNNLPKNILVRMSAGSCMTEKINIYVQQCQKSEGGAASAGEWGDWILYDTLYKYTTSGANDPALIGNDYWLRTNPWAGFNYDPILNTIDYVFDNSKQGQITDPDTALMLQNGIPQLSGAMSDLGDAMILGNNRYGYNNFDDGTMKKLDVDIQFNPLQGCTKPLRKVRMYAYVGYATDNFSYISQVGWYNGQDTQERFGGIDTSNGTLATVNINESKYFQLDFSDHSAFVCYAKGTPYYAVGTWYQVNSDNSLVKLDALLDISNPSILEYIQNVFNASGYFICVFDLEVPAGRYDFAIGRHNVALSGDFRNTSTYVAGIANSRQHSPNNVFLTPMDSIVSFSKEMEIDCTNGDVDTWGNGKDVFYIYCPHQTVQYRFIEGYLFESINEQIPVELFPYTLNRTIDGGGTFTDKNGFYFADTRGNHAGIANIQLIVKFNCAYPKQYEIPTSHAGIGWCPNAPAFMANYNGGVFGDCNRIIYSGKITSLDGTIPYSNIAVSIVDGSTAYTNQDGVFTLIVHNGQGTNRVSNIYVNAGGNYIITLDQCGDIPLFNFDENNAPCIFCNKRTYPLVFNVASGQLFIIVTDVTQTSTNEGSSYSIGLAGADLAGRLMNVNEIKVFTVPTFQSRGNTLATFFRLLITGAFNIATQNPDIKWVSPYVSKNLTELYYIDWVGDSIKFIDNAGNVVSDPSTAVLVSIAIDSLYNTNLSKNFSLLTSYQFTPGDRLRILDDGNGNLLTPTNFGAPIDVDILGTNYNQAAQAAGIVPSTSAQPIINNTINNNTSVTNAATATPVISQSTQANNTSITLYIRYTPQLNQLLGNTGFWIEIYTPIQVNNILPYFECGGFYPIINGAIAIFTGYSVGLPVYIYPKTLDIDFWDTYLLQRTITIPNVGDKYFPHPFKSPNISDTFGSNITSGGRLGNVKNVNAKQMWFGADIIKSDNFVNEGLLNGLGIFRTVLGDGSSNRHDYSSYPWGAIQALFTFRNAMIAICQNDFFTTDYNFHYAYGNEQGVMITNLSEGLSTPHQKIGNNYGCAEEDVATIIFFDKYVGYYDRKNTAYVLCDYREAKPISDNLMKSWFNTKSDFITAWNNVNDLKDKFDVIAGIDLEVMNIYVSFRPRRNNTNDKYSYINDRRNWQLNFQETVVYNLDSKRWVRSTGFTPEFYGKLRGNFFGTQLFSFAAGKSYYHNSNDNGFCNFYGIPTTPVIILSLNKTAEIKKYKSMTVDSNEVAFWSDLLYTDFINSFSYIPLNYFDEIDGKFYAEFLRNMNTYPPTDPKELFRSMIFDGMQVTGRYCIMRLIFDIQKLGLYTQLAGIDYSFEMASSNKKE